MPQTWNRKGNAAKFPLKKYYKMFSLRFPYNISQQEIQYFFYLLFILFHVMLLLFHKKQFFTMEFYDKLMTFLLFAVSTQINHY